MNMNTLRTPRYTRFEKAIVAGTGLLMLLLSGCGSEAVLDEKPASTTEQAFIDRANSITVYPGKAAEVAQIQDDLRDEYDEYDVYDPSDDWGDDHNNSLAFHPRRFTTEFTKGDGSGTDTVCEDLGVPESAKYVEATTTSDKQAWVFYNGEKNTAYLCYPADNNPRDVMVWAGNEPR